jgi:hypothetical protein
VLGGRGEDVLGHLHSVWIVDRIGLFEFITAKPVLALFRTFREADEVVA